MVGNLSWMGKVVFLAAVLAVGICVTSAGAFAQQGDAPAVKPSAAAPAATNKATNGSVKCTADINADGSIFACKHCNPADTMHLVPTGEYQVGFSKPCLNITSANGWSRWVQVDPLSASSSNAYCTTADRSGDVNAIYVQCQDNTGAAVDASFYLFIAR
jgi:hypothetical protein